MLIKPMLAVDYEVSKLKYPLALEPKIDGVRSVYFNEGVTGRSLKKHRNKFVTEYFSNPIFKGIDGEMAVLDETHHDLCRMTSKALSTAHSKPNITWHCFDYITEKTRSLIYIERYNCLSERLLEIELKNKEASKHLSLVSMKIVTNYEQLVQEDIYNNLEGYEGSIVRDLYGLYKEGYTTVNEGTFLRIKHFVEEDAIVVDVVEGFRNDNAAIINELGYKERSFKKSNLVRNGQIASFICIDCKTKKKITVAVGKLPKALRYFYFKNKHLIIGQTIKYRYFPKGMKDKPRFPTYQSHRIDSDIVNV